MKGDYKKSILSIVALMLSLFVLSLDSFAGEVEDIGLDIAIVKTETANLREAPSRLSPIISRLKKQDMLVLIDQEPKEERLKVNFNKGEQVPETINAPDDWIDVTDKYKNKPESELKSLTIKPMKPLKGGWYNVIDINSGEEGWIYGDLIDIQYTANRKKANIFNAEKIDAITKPEVVIKNDSYKDLRLKVGSNTFMIDKHSEKIISMDIGSFDYYASAPGVIPAIGEQTFETGYRYSWRFWIETKIGFGIGKHGGRYKRR